MNDVQDLISIQTALAAEASAEQRAAGARACRAILHMLEGTPPGEPIVAPPVNAASIANLVGALRDVPVDQVLDLAIAKLRSLVPASAEPNPAVASKMNLQLVRIPAPRPGDRNGAV